VTQDPDSPENLSREALDAYQLGAYEDAIHGFQAAKREFLNRGDDINAAEAANNLSVVLLKMDRMYDALDTVKGTPEIFRRAGNSQMEALALGNLAAALEATGEVKQAEECYIQALTNLDESDDQETRSYILQALSRLQLRGGKPFAALTSMQGALDSQPRRSWRDRILRKLFDLPARLLGRGS
jgi:tetratricopeptide (TPR) repeat protein